MNSTLNLALIDWLDRQHRFGILVIDTSFVVLKINQWFIENLGAKKTHELAGKNLFEYFPEIKERKLDKYFDQVLLGENVVLSNTFHKYLIPIEININSQTVLMQQTAEMMPLYSTENKIIGIVIIIIDVTERIEKENELKNKINQLLKLQRELKESEGKFRALANNLPDIVLRFNKNLQCIYLNDKIEFLTGSKPEYYLNKNISDDIFNNPFFVELEKNIREVFEKKQFKIYDSTFNSVKGTFIFEVRLLLEVQNGGTEYVLAIIRDVNELRKFTQKLQSYAKELEILNANKDKFFSIIAHDLKGPFNSLFNFSKIMIDDYPKLSREKVFRYITHLYSSIEGIFNLLVTLLEWAQIQRGKMEFQPNYYKLDELVERIIKANKNFADNKNIVIEKNIEKDFEVFIDYKMMNTLIHNLIVNALKFTNAGGKVSIDVSRYDKYFEIRVKDTGIGMDEETKNNLFNISKVKSRKGTANESGTGLGLLLCKEMVDFHKGKIEVESELGKGTTFIVTIPQ